MALTPRQRRLRMGVPRRHLNLYQLLLALRCTSNSAAVLMTKADGGLADSCLQFEWARSHGLAMATATSPFAELTRIPSGRKYIRLCTQSLKQNVRSEAFDAGPAESPDSCATSTQEGRRDEGISPIETERKRVCHSIKGHHSPFSLRIARKATTTWSPQQGQHSQPGPPSGR